MAKKTSIFEAYLKICMGSKLLINNKVYEYRNLNRGKVCSLSAFEKFLARKLKLPTKDMELYAQLDFFDMLKCTII